jgi:hypothetical protein
MTAIYPPLDLLLFAAIGHVSYSPMAVKVVMAAVDLATLLLLLLVLRQRRLDARWALLYALQPVVIYAFAGEGHIDALQNLTIVGLLLAHSKRRWRWFFLFAGLAAQVKYVALVVWPFLVNRNNRRHAWIAAAAFLLPLLPFLILDGPGVFRSLRAFGERFAFNGSLHAVLLHASGSAALAGGITRSLFVLVLIIGYRHSRARPSSSQEHSAAHLALPADDPAAALLLVMGAFLLCAPTVHYWYLSWLVPLLVLRPAAAWILLLGTISWVFIAPGVNALNGSWILPSWAQWLIWSVPLPLIVRHAWRAWRRPSRSYFAPRSIAVVIPTLNEAKRLRGCIEALRGEPAVRQIIVVDGGSSDRTAAVADELGVTLLKHHASPARGGGRGGQIAAGCRLVTADLVAIVHADVRLSAGALERARKLLIVQPDLVGGALGAVFNGHGLRYRLLELGNDLRALFGGITFGDQVQFFRRDPIISEGRFPAIPLMEDVELALRLNRLGRTAFLFERCAVSTRSWRRNAGAKSALVVWLTLRYLVERRLHDGAAARMYDTYYGPPSAPKG